MNKTILVIGGLVLVILLGIFVFYSTGGINPFATQVPPAPIDTDNTDETPDQTSTATAPVAITSATVASFDTSAVVSGSITPNGAFTSYWYEYGTTASLGKKVANQAIGSGYTALGAPTYITGLTKDTTYYFRLVAENQFGTTAGAQHTFRTTTNTPAPVGSTPVTKTLAATGISRTGATLSGEVTPNNTVTQFWFEYGKTSNLGVGSTLQSVGDGTTKVPAALTLASLTPATTYYFRLNSQNQFGTTNGAILTFKTLGPAVSVAVPVVTTQVVAAVATTTATLRGTVNPYDSQTTYWFEYSTSGQFSGALLKTTQKKSAGAGADTVSVDANITALKTATTYYYRTVAENAGGTVRGDTLTFKTK